MQASSTFPVFGGAEVSYRSPLLLSAAFTALLLAVLLAVVTHSLNVLLLALGVLFVPLAGALFPTAIVAVFLFFNLLFPKLPLIQVQGYMVPIRIEDVFLACALLCLLLRRLFYQEPYTPNPLAKWMLLFCGVTWLSFLFGWLVLGSVPGAKIGFLFWLRNPEYFATCSLCLLGTTSRKQYQQLLGVFVFYVLLIGVYGILQEYGHVPMFNAMHLTDEIVVIQFMPGFGQERLFSTFAGPYDLAAFYLLAVPILGTLLAAASSRLHKLVLALVLGLSFFCLYLTYSRAALASIAAVLLVLLWSAKKHLLALAIIPVCILPAFLFTNFVERLNVAADPFSYNSLGGRMESGWADALASAARSPLLGTGPASLGEGMGVDGMYLMLLGMWGVAGLASYGWLVAKTMRRQRQIAQSSGNWMQRALAMGMIAGSVGLLVNAISVDSFFVSKVAFAYWWLMGLLLAGQGIEWREGRSTLEAMRA